MLLFAYVLSVVALFFVSPSISQTSCSTNGDCQNGVCDDFENTTECICHSGYIGNQCDEAFNITVTVEESVPEKGSNVTFFSTIYSPNDTSLELMLPDKDTITLPTANGEVRKIEDVAFSDVGSYRFTASTNYDGRQWSITDIAEISYVLTVEINSTKSEEIFVKGKNDASLSVEVQTYGNFSFVNVSVAKDGSRLGELSPTGSGITRQYAYSFTQAVNPADAGVYKFTATENYEGRSRMVVKNITVTVQETPTAPTVNATSENVTRGIELWISCQPSGGNPAPLTSWSHGGVNVSRSTSDHIYQPPGTGMLVFGVEASFNASGTYTCTAKNILGMATSNVTVNVVGPPTFQASESESILQKESLNFSCSFDAYPRASISWRWNGSNIGHGEIFNIEEEVESLYYRTTSRLMILHSALCLGRGTLTCSASNELNPNDPKTSDFQINHEKYSLYRNSYFVFPGEKKSFQAAFDYCNGIGGSLADILDEDEQNAVVGVADGFSINEFYIGLRRETSGWKWVNTNDGLSYDNWANTEPSSGCALNKKEASGWSWVSVDCDQNKTFCCEVTASKFPSAVNVTSDRCNGQLADIRWIPDGSFGQSVEITSTPDSRIENVFINVSSKQYTDLSFETQYQAKVSSGVGICSHLPYAEKRFTTAYQEAARPTVTVDPDTCKVSWTYPEGRKSEVEFFNVAVTEDVNVGTPGNPKTVFNGNQSDYVYQIVTNPNSRYNIQIRTLSCIGNSEPAASTCTTPVSIIEPPSNSIDITSGTQTDTSSGISISITKVSERNGPVSCLYIVARWRRSGDAFTAFNIDQASFDAIQQNDSPSQEGQDYFTFAGQNENRNVTLGSKNVFNCPSSRRRRAVVPNTAVSAYNQPLESDVTYQFYIITAVSDGSNFLISNSPWSNSVQVSKPSEPPNALAIALPITIVVLLILLIVLFLLMRKRKAGRKKQENQQTSNSVSQTRNAHINQAFAENLYENPQKDTSVAVENLRSTYQTKHADEDRLYREEYRALATEVSELVIHFNYAMAPEVREKNRFSNIHPANESRVVLRREGNDIYSDYINASYMDGYRHPRKFIAAQGPLKNTIGDFWYMVWEQESTVVVMLTRVDEGGRRKCEKYWPEDNEQCTFDNLMVKTISTVEYGAIIKRTFQLSNPNQSDKVLIVEQFHYITWPDHGVPITTSALFNLRRLVTESQGNNPSPIVVHCSAGVGRTGTFIALDYLSHEMERESKVDVYGTIINMRRKRKEMVQTMDQYVFLHKLMLEKHLFGITDMKTSEFSNAHNGLYESLDEDHFYNLSIVHPLSASIHVPEDALPYIRDKDIVPYQQGRVIIRMRPSEEKTRYINASYVQTYSASESFIACQAPVESGIENFWRTILDHNVTAIVMLSKLRENGEEQCSQYWPDNCETPAVFGDITITLQSENKADGITERLMFVSEKVLHLRRSLNVMQLQYDWPERSVPSDASGILDVVARSQASRKMGQGKSPVLVHCRDGSGRTGTFCAIVNLIERLKNEDRVDVFRTVKDLRDMRPLMVKSLEQYRFCVKAVKEYLDSFQLYANFK